MSLFDKLGGSRSIELDSQGGLLLAALTMVAIDGDVDDDELAIIRRLDRSGRNIAWDSAYRVFRTKDTEECVQMASLAMNSEQKIAAIANLVDIAMADGDLMGEEKKLLEKYVAVFDVNHSEVEKIVDVIATKNDRSLFQA